MKLYKADFHIHTVLSPCGDLDMSPENIVKTARHKGLDILGITDHNSTRQCDVMKKIGAREGIYILCGVEVNTKEEVHCLAFFHYEKDLQAFEKFMDGHLPDIKNDPDKFGYQVVVDENDHILAQPDKLLINALNANINEVEQKVHSMGGLFIPAHIDRLRNGIIQQLGFIPPDLQCDGLEISPFSDYSDVIEAQMDLNRYTFIRGSDAHYPEDIGKVNTSLYLEEAGFSEVKMALSGSNGRKVLIE
jgi:PHP family Zn ribbon phosphoesterase